MSNIDDLFKKVLDSHSEPYDPAAWENLSKRLDQSIKPGKNPFLKWGIPSVAIIVGAAIAWYFISVEPQRTTQVAQGPKQNSSVSTNAKESQGNFKKPSQKKETLPNVPKISYLENQNSNTTNPKVLPLTNTSNDGAVVKSHELPTSEKLIPAEPQTGKLDQDPVIVDGPKTVSNFKALTLPTCANDAVEVRNENNFSVLIVSKEHTVKIEANAVAKVKLSEGNYAILQEASQENLQNHAVAGTSKTEIVVGDLFYAAGLPYRHASLKTDQAIIALSAEGTSVTCCNKDFDMLSFTKGNYVLNVETTNDNGCRGKVSETFYVSDDYNLLAVNAFEPLSQDTRKSVFIPYALTQRNTPFKMIVIDPSDGGIVFETSDAQMPWDGVDKRNGKLAETNKAYIWKVNITKPEPGEKVDYIGTVVRM